MVSEAGVGMVHAILNSVVAMALFLARCSTAFFAFNRSFQLPPLNFGITIGKASGLVSKLTAIASSAIFWKFWKCNCVGCYGGG
ncbi:hypothetical protein HOY80DRAFT_968310 [Tuber brumale]|nr:hypothetical protein HOY80DRAFT_968310 [Tuber brumale]